MAHKWPQERGMDSSGEKHALSLVSRADGLSAIHLCKHNVEAILVLLESNDDTQFEMLR
jgi:hypothetical protein